jgi:hypothetical protein
MNSKSVEVILSRIFDTPRKRVWKSLDRLAERMAKA